jgi:hypothetical protein
VPEVTIPPEVTPENVTTCIIDSSCGSRCHRPHLLQISTFSHPTHLFTLLSASPSSRHHLLSILPRAHVICLVYSIADPATFDRVAEYWLPLFRREGVNVPVILVGNKIDMRGGEVTNEALEEEIGPLMREFKVSSLGLMMDVGSCVLSRKTVSAGDRDRGGMFCQDTLERLGSLLFRSESRFTSYRAPL